jgi:Lon protease-like protein
MTVATDTIPLFPLSHGVFPDGMLQLQIFEVRYLDLIKRCHREHKPFGVAWLKQGSEVQVPGEQPLLHVHGCMAHIREFEQVQPALQRVICQGGLRFELHSVNPGPYGVWQGTVSYLPQDAAVELPSQWQPHANRLGQWIATAQKQGLQDRLPLFAPYQLDDCGWVANRFAEVLPMEPEQKLRLMTEVDPIKRMAAVDVFLSDEV